jgi:hypothetical protein
VNAEMMPRSTYCSHATRDQNGNIINWREQVFCFCFFLSKNNKLFVPSQRRNENTSSVAPKMVAKNYEENEEEFIHSILHWQFGAKPHSPHLSFVSDPP